MTKEELQDWVLNLAVHRPIFYSEADFQLELGFELKSKGHEVRLERPIHAKDGKTFELDIVVDNEVVIELKYKKIECKYEIGNEIFILKKDGGGKENRYKIFEDVWRVRHLVERKSFKKGFVVLMTNDDQYWKCVSKKLHAYRFDLSDGRALRNGQTLEMGGEKFYDPIEIKFNDVLKWVDYKTGNQPDNLNTGFRFLVIDVNNS